MFNVVGPYTRLLAAVANVDVTPIHVTPTSGDLVVDFELFNRSYIMTRSMIGYEHDTVSCLSVC